MILINNIRDYIIWFSSSEYKHAFFLYWTPFILYGWTPQQHPLFILQKKHMRFF